MDRFPQGYGSLKGCRSAGRATCGLFEQVLRRVFRHDARALAPRHEISIAREPLVGLRADAPTDAIDKVQTQIACIISHVYLP